MYRRLEDGTQNEKLKPAINSILEAVLPCFCAEAPRSFSNSQDQLQPVLCPFRLRVQSCFSIDRKPDVLMRISYGVKNQFGTA